MKNFALQLTAVGALVVCASGIARAQWGITQAQSPPAQSTSRGENFSAKPAPQLFASDCTGSGCHRGPQGLAKDRGQSSLAAFLREHYTNSRESAAALAAYLVGVPGDARAARPPRPATRTDEPPKPAEDASRARRQPAGEPPEQAKPAAAAAKPPRGRQAATPAPVPVPAAQVPAAQVPAAASEPPAPPPEPPAPSKPQWDIFD